MARELTSSFKEVPRFITLAFKLKRLKPLWNQPSHLLVRPKRFELLTPWFVVNLLSVSY